MFNGVHYRIFQVKISNVYSKFIRKIDASIRWENSAAIICLYEHETEQGYVVIGKPESEKDTCVLEWRAPNINLEQKLLFLAAVEIRQRHRPTKPIQLFALPQYMSIDQLSKWVGPVQTSNNQDKMMRNIRLPTDIYEKIKNTFSNGAAVFWPGDYF